MPVCPDVRTDAVRPSNVPYDTCCQICSRPRHIDQYFERQRLCPGAQGRSGVGGTRPTSAMRNQGDAPAGSASGVCSQDKTPLEPAQQDRSPSGEQSPVSIQAAYVKANLQFLSLCCPTPLLESIAFLWSLVASILGRRQPTPVVMSLAVSLPMVVCLPPEPSVTCMHSCAQCSTRVHGCVSV